jgi:hypothetical protein
MHFQDTWAAPIGGLRGNCSRVVIGRTIVTFLVTVYFRFHSDG